MQVALVPLQKTEVRLDRARGFLLRRLLGLGGVQDVDRAEETLPVLAPEKLGEFLQPCLALQDAFLCHEPLVQNGLAVGVD